MAGLPGCHSKVSASMLPEMSSTIMMAMPSVGIRVFKSGTRGPAAASRRPSKASARSACAPDANSPRPPGRKSAENARIGKTQRCTPSMQPPHKKQRRERQQDQENGIGKFEHGIGPGNERSLHDSKFGRAAKEALRMANAHAFSTRIPATSLISVRKRPGFATNL